MARYTDTQEMAFNNLRETRAIIVTGGDLVVSSWDGLAYNEIETLVKGPYEYFTRGLRLRFVPAAGATYTIEEGGRK
jgi:hypothetical protein